MDTETATFDVGRMARLLGASRSGYYAWAERQAAGPGPAQQRRDELAVKIIGFHADSDHVYGSPRILADLRADGEQVSAKTVAKLVRVARDVLLVGCLPGCHPFADRAPVGPGCLARHANKAP